jgi:hypothetical protein
MFATREAVIESTKRPALGRAVALQDQDCLVHQLMAGPIAVVEVVEE